MAKVVLANWKASLAPNRVDSWLQNFSSTYRPVSSVQVVLAVPFLYMNRVAEKIKGLEQVTIAAQGVSPYPQGGYTGATPADWLQGLARYALVGHRERRLYFHEDVQVVAAQMRESIAAGLLPILCLDRADRNSQLAALDESDLDESLLAYTPQDAVKLEVASASQDIVDTAAALAASSGGRPVLYGGGVNEDNAAELANLAGIFGIMVGRSSLDGSGFAELVNRVGKA